MWSVSKCAIYVTFGSLELTIWWIMCGRGAFKRAVPTALCHSGDCSRTTTKARFGQPAVLTEYPQLSTEICRLSCLHVLAYQRPFYQEERTIVVLGTRDSTNPEIPDTTQGRIQGTNQANGHDHSQDVSREGQSMFGPTKTLKSNSFINAMGKQSILYIPGK